MSVSVLKGAFGGYPLSEKAFAICFAGGRNIYENGDCAPVDHACSGKKPERGIAREERNLSPL